MRLGGRSFAWTLGAGIVLGVLGGAGPNAVASDVFSIFYPNRPINDEEDLYSSTDFGGVGLLQTRTARFGPDGQMDVGASFVDEYWRYYINWHFLPFMEATFRYTDIRNKLFSNVEDFSGNQSFKDRGADIKLKLWEESANIPAIAVGIQDGLGTGVFAGEYLVASKRFYDLDFHFGMGWGYSTGSSGQVTNPLTYLSDSFLSREGNRKGGGRLNPESWFSGETASLFGGVEWRTPLDGLMVKLEYDPNNYQNEPLDNRFDQASHWNAGLVYRPFSWVDTSIAFERGNVWMYRMALRTNLNEPGLDNFLDDAPPPLLSREEAGEAAEPEVEDPPIEMADNAETPQNDDASAVFDALEQQGFVIEAVELTGTEAQIAVSRGPANWNRVTISRAAMRIFKTFPDGLNRVSLVSAGARGYRMSIDRDDAERTVVVNDLFDGLEAEGFQFEGFELSHGEALVRVQSASEKIDGAVDRRAARLIFEKLPGPIERVTLLDRDGVRDRPIISVSREENDRTGSVDDLFESVESQGMAVRNIQISQRHATIYAAAPSDHLDRRVRAAALKVASLTPDFADLVTVVGVRSGGDNVRATVSTTGAQLVNLSVGRDGEILDSTGSHSVDALERERIASKIFGQLAKTGFIGEGFDITGRTATVYIVPEKFRDSGRNIGWPARIVANNVPPWVEEITVVEVLRGMEVNRVSIMRKDLENAIAGRGSVDEIFAHAVIEGGEGLSQQQAFYRNPKRYPDFAWNLTPRLRQHVGSPEAFYLYQIYAALSGRLEIAPGLRLAGTYSRNLVDTFDQLKNRSDSQLPKVRSDVIRYLRDGKSGVANLYLDYVFSPYTGWYAKVIGGLLEDMYGGIAGEVLYRPFKSRLAVGLEIARVRQRAFERDFDFRDYEVTTGHMSFYYSIPAYNMNAQIDVGQYLAKDKGATFSLARTFNSGVSVGAFFTLTDVPFEEFGEGSFDKGFYVRVPFDVFLPKSSRRAGTFLFRPLTRDGGQRVHIPGRLMGYAGDGTYQTVTEQWNTLLD